MTNELFPNFMQPVKDDGKKCGNCKHACQTIPYWTDKKYFFCELQSGKNFTGCKYIRLKNKACYFFERGRNFHKYHSV
ncbi:MAG: hypothetical protein LBC75_01010 [Fibromonadaceae bacterium]|jgi:hypothetical protein|nr:hypothetical protein [Fibromonadaceae bacterium]